MQWIMTIVGYPLGYIMWAIYQIVPVYAVALVLFTIITKLAMIPLSIKQQKSMVQQARIQPKVAEIQKKYANNREKQSEEMQKLYSDEGVSMSSGCLPLLIQFPILFGLIDVIYKPMTHILHLPKATISAIETLAKTLDNTAVTSYASEITAFQTVKANPAAFLNGGIASDVVDKITGFNMSLGSIDLAAMPTWGWNLLVLIPILSGLTALLSSIISMKANPSNGQAGASTKVMMLMMPLLSVWFTFKVPAGVGFYWIISNVLAAIQAAILNKYYNPKKMAAQIEADAAAKKEEERQARIEAKKVAKAAGRDPDAEAKLSQKEANRRKLAEARKRNAEKYGDTYVEVTDDDLK